MSRLRNAATIFAAVSAMALARDSELQDQVAAGLKTRTRDRTIDPEPTYPNQPSEDPQAAQIRAERAARKAAQWAKQKKGAR